MRRSFLLRLPHACLVALFVCASLAAPARAQSGGNYQITQSVVPGGGGASAATGYSVTGVVGQGASGSSSGGGYALAGGFVNAAQTPAASISGRVTLASNGAGLASVTVTLTRPDNTTTAATTDASGNYSFAGLTTGGYSVALSKLNYSFAPASQPVTLTAAGATGIDFAATSTAAGSGASGAILISEFRLQGPAPSSPAAGNTQGELDEFVELYNTTNAAVAVGGYIIDTSAGFSVTLPQGATIPARGHYLVANAGGYSLSDYGGAGSAAPDFTYSGFDLQAGTGLALLDASGAILDAVGTTTSPAPYREGSGLPAVSGAGEYSFVRGLSTGAPRDAGDNAADFVLAATDGGVYSGLASVLGAPGPENSTSPINRGATIKSSLLDATQTSSASPNRVRDSAPDVCNGGVAPSNCTAGTLSVRRRFTNNTGANVTKLRFRVVNITTFPVPSAGVADVRLIGSTAVSQGGVNDPTTCSASAAGGAPCTVTVRGTALESPPAQAMGGGYNSSSTVTAITLATPLAPGASINVQFLLGVRQTGNFAFLVVVEAVP